MATTEALPVVIRLANLWQCPDGMPNNLANRGKLAFLIRGIAVDMLDQPNYGCPVGAAGALVGRGCKRLVAKKVQKGPP